MEKLKVALIGAGFMGGIHIARWSIVGNAEVIAVVDINEERARRLAREYNVKSFYKNYKDVLKEDKIDVVDVCTPTYTHKEIAVESMEHGKHVIVEKPIALRLKDADEMIKASERNHVKFMVAHCLRFWPEYVAAKEIVDSGELGEPRIVRAYRQSPFPDWAPWHNEIKLGGGVFIDMSIHDIDFLRWAIGEVNEVYARGGVLRRRNATAYDYVHAVLKFSNGAVGYVEGSWIMPKTFPFTTYLEIVGNMGILKVDNHTTSSVKVFTEEKAFDYTFVYKDAYYEELNLFTRSIIEDAQPPISGLEARKTLEVVLAAVKSIMENKPVKLPLKGDIL